MARQVYDNYMVAHVWAQQEQESARSDNGNFYFKGTAIYSYRDSHPVGNFVMCPDGAKAVLLWDGNYSRTTSSHQNLACYAVRGQRTFHVSDLLIGHHALGVRAQANLDKMITTFRAVFEELMRKAANLNSNMRGWVFDCDLPTRHSAIVGYAAAFRLKLPKDIKTYNNEQAREAYVAARQAAVAKREEKAKKARERLLARFGGDTEALAWYERRKSALAKAATASKYLHDSRLSYKRRSAVDAAAEEISALFDRDPTDEAIMRYHADFENYQYTIRHRARLKVCLGEGRYGDAAVAAFLALPSMQDRIDAALANTTLFGYLPLSERAAAWRAGARVRLASGGPALLRINPRDADEIETSQGACFPRAHAIRAWRVLRIIFARGVAWQRNGEEIRLGHFHIDKVSADGIVRAGCHLIERAECERLAAELGLAPVGLRGRVEVLGSDARAAGAAGRCLRRYTQQFIAERF